MPLGNETWLLCGSGCYAPRDGRFDSENVAWLPWTSKSREHQIIPRILLSDLICGYSFDESEASEAFFELAKCQRGFMDFWIFNDFYVRPVPVEDSVNQQVDKLPSQ